MSAVRPAVLIPTYNNIGSVASVATRARAHGLAVYVVDDGSTDGSGEAAKAAGATLVVHADNLGKGRALLTGMARLRAAGHTHAICLDGDGQHDPEDIPSFATACHRHPNAIVAGVRDLATAPGKSRFGRAFSNFWIWAETGWRVADSQCGFRAYPIEAVLALGLDGRRYDMEVEVLTRCLWRGTPVFDLPCKVYYPPPSQRVTSFHPFWDNVRISLMNTRLVLRRLVDPRLWPAARERLPWTGRTRGVVVGWRAAIWGVQTLGPTFVAPFVQLACVFYWLINPSSRHNINRFNERAGSRRSSYVTFSSYATALLDRLAFLALGPGRLRQKHDGVDPLVTVFQGKSGAVLLSGHLGNIEVATGASALPERLRRIHIVRFVGAHDPWQRVMENTPEAWRPSILAVNQTEGFAAIEIVRRLRAGAVVAMHGDRAVDERSVRAEFLGHPADFPAGPWLVAALARVPVIIVGNFHEGGGTYRLLTAPPMSPVFDRSRPRDEQLREWAQAYADILAGWARRYPEQWYNFHDFWQD